MKYKNDDDHNEFINSLSDLFKKDRINNKITKRIKDVKNIDDHEDIWNTLFGPSRDKKLNANCKTVNDLLNQLIYGIKNTKGQSTIYFADDDLTLDFSISSCILNANDVFEINLETTYGGEIPVKDAIKTIKDAMSKYHVNGNIPFIFKFRGSSLEIESISLIMHHDDDDSIVSIIFKQDAVQKAKKRIDNTVKPTDLLTSLQNFADEHTNHQSSYVDTLKIVAVDDEGSKPIVFQLKPPVKQQNQIVINLEKCPNWRFKDFADDPGTMTVGQFKKAISKLSNVSGYIFLRSKNTTYEISKIDTLEGERSIGEPISEIIALKIVPWDGANESLKNKTYTKKQIQEAINYWKHQLKIGNYKHI